MEISNPRRILAVSLEESVQHLSQVVKDLTGSHPQPPSPDASLAGTTHALPLSTPYYTASIPIWLDVIAAPPDEWATSFLSAEADEVRAALGGLVVVFPLSGPADGQKDLVRAVGRFVRDGLGGWEWDGVGVAVGVAASGSAAVSDDVRDLWEDECAVAGLELVIVGTGAKPEERNEFGEKMGIPRVLEALQANDWAQADSGEADEVLSDFGEFVEGKTKEGRGAEGRGGDDDDDDDDDDNDVDLDPESLDFGFDREDFAGLKKAIWKAGRDEEGDDDAQEDIGNDDILKMEQMMRKLQAVRDMSAGLPEDQRKRMAARAVGEVMKEL